VLTNLEGVLHQIIAIAVTRRDTIEGVANLPSVAFGATYPWRGRMR
jgi:hypothetical protein